MPTAKEYDKYGHGKPLPTPKVKNKHAPNNVVYSDISEDGDVSTASNAGVDDNTVPYDDPVLARVRLRFYPSAAAGSATQLNDDGVFVRGVVAGSSSPLNTQLKVLTQTCGSQGMSDVIAPPRIISTSAWSRPGYTDRSSHEHHTRRSYLR